MTQAGGERGEEVAKCYINEKGFWEGGVIPNMCNDETSLARFQL